MRTTPPRHGSTWAVAAALMTGAVAVFALAWSRPPFGPKPGQFGVTFSKKYAADLGTDWKASYLAMLDDLKVREFRIPVYWDEVERERGRFDWQDVDWMLEQAADRGAAVTLVIGRKVPRWPECHVPDWAARLTREQQDARVMALVEAEVRRFKDAPALKRWQVENEPLFLYGKCPPPDRDLLRREVELVRSLDSRPIQLTDSGELSFWLRSATLADTLGISLYRTVWNRWFGFWFWPLSPSWYAERIAFIKPLTRGRHVVVSELQAEPWFSKPFAETPIDEQLEIMSVRRFRDNVEFAARTGASEIYLWGAEWWYWLKLQGRPEFWEEARRLFP